MKKITKDARLMFLFVSISIFMVALGIGFFLGNSMGSQSAKGYPDLFIKEGIYDAFSVKKAFNYHTGEPVYLIIAMTLREEDLSNGVTTGKILQGDLKFYKVPRTRIANLPHDKIADPNFFFSGEIVVK